MKNLYYSIKQDNSEIYVENITESQKESLQDYLIEKLKTLRKIMPRSEWKITIEQEIYNHSSRYRKFEIFNVATKELITREV